MGDAVVVDRLMTPEELCVREIDAPVLGPDEVRIDVRAAGCNFSDLLMLKGEYQVKPPLPFVPGGEVAGVVARWARAFADRIGERVFALRARGLCARRSRRLPAEGPLDAGGALLRRGARHCRSSIRRRMRRWSFARRPEPGETLLVHAAAGGVGLAAVQIGKALGARVIASAGGARSSRWRVRRGGRVIDYREKDDFVDACSRRPTDEAQT